MALWRASIASATLVFWYLLLPLCTVNSRLQEPSIANDFKNPHQSSKFKSDFQEIEVDVNVQLQHIKPCVSCESKAL